MIIQSDNILNAIRNLGGINPDKLAKCGTETEWRELPSSIRLQIFRKASKQGPDEIASQLEQFGVHSENDLLWYLKDPTKVKLTDTQASDYDWLVAELEAVRKERDRLAMQYTIHFVQVGRNYIPYRLPVTDTPF
jgi:hypothetical protein